MFEMSEEEIIAAVDCVKLGQAYTSLQRSGNTWSGRCPLCRAPGATFEVHGRRGPMRCSACGFDDGPVDLVHRIEGTGFRRTMETLYLDYLSGDADE